MKRCTKCEKEKELSEFYYNGRGKLRTDCKKCVNARNAERVRQRFQEPRSRTLWTMYKMTVADFDDELSKQGDVCAICKESSTEWHVDHDHSCCLGERTCGKCVRGVLCPLCNRALGNFRDDPVRMRAAADYIERYN